MTDMDAKLEPFLNQYLAGCIEKVELLEGGRMNNTFRLYFKDELPFILPEHSNNHNLLARIHQSKPSSLVVKIPCPYMMVLGNPIPFPINRQQIEEKALKLFHKCQHQIFDTGSVSIDFSSILERHKTIRIGSVWLRDEENHVLMLDDHGPLLNIVEWFLSENKSLPSKAILSLARAYGEQLGHFVVDMQVSSLPYLMNLKILLYNPELEEKIFKIFVDSIESICNTHGLCDFNELSSIFTSYFEHDNSRAAADGQAFVHSDLWHGNLLVDERSLTLSIIDWEFSTVRSPARDLAFFLVRARVHEVTHPLYKPMLSFINGFMDAYRDSAKTRKAPWYENESERYLFAWDLGILYGAMLIQNTPFQMCCTVQDEICSHRRNAVIEGADYLRRCRLGSGKTTYNCMSHDKFLGRLF